MHIIRKASKIPVRNRTEILVVGGGPAGFGAAVSAARAGAKVTLVEQGGLLGGMWTLGLLSPFFDNWHHDGLNRELREKLSLRGAWGGRKEMTFDQNEMVMLLDEYVTSLNIDVLLYTMGTEPILDENLLKGIFIQNKSGTQAILADIVIDCTGDGDIAARAGAPFKIGRETDGAFQPMTMMFKIGGLRKGYNRDDLRSWYDILIQRIPEKEILAEIPYNNPALITLPRQREALIQWTHIQQTLGTNAEQLTAATFEGRRQIRKAFEYFKLVRDQLGDVYLLDLPAVIGVRETRRIIGEYVISDEDVKNGTVQPDTVCHVRFGVDIHEPCQTEQTCWKHPGFDIPLRSLIPLKIENLMTAGRCISGSFSAHAAYRVTGDCLKMGEGAGAAATAAINSGCSIRSYSKMLRKK